MSKSFAVSTTHKGDTIYNRCFHFKEKKCLDIISKQYSVENKNVVLTSSGIEGLSFLLENIMASHKFQKMNVFYSDELYCDTPRLIEYYSKLYGCYYYQSFDVNDYEGLKSELSKYPNDINLVIMESCSNPTGKVFDYAKIKDLKSQFKRLEFIVDNTWLTHVAFNPFQYGVDYVFSSTSKYYSGGNCIGGLIVSPKTSFMKNMNDFKRISGRHISLPYCDILLKNLPMMDKRLPVSFQKTLKLAEFLDKHPNVNKVHYPLLRSSPNFETASKYFGVCGPSVLSFEVEMKKDPAVQWMKSFKTVEYETSFGSYKTKFDTWPRFIKPDRTRCRIAVGYDSNIDRIIDEFRTKL